MGCTVLAFDPTVNKEDKLADKIYFRKLGVSKKKIDVNG